MSQEISQLRREQWTNPNVGRRPRFAAHRAGTKAAVRGTCSCVVKQGSLLLLGNCWDWHAVPVGSRASTLAGIWSCLVYVRAQVAADLRGLPVSRTGAGAGHAAGLECWGWAHCQERCLCLRLARQWLHGGEGQSLVPPPCQTEGWGHPRYTPLPPHSWMRIWKEINIIPPWTGEHAQGTWEAPGKVELPWDRPCK